MFDFITSIGSVITTLIEHIVQIAQTTLSVFAHIPQYMTFLANAISFLPSIVVPFALSSLALQFCYFLIGKDD